MDSGNATGAAAGRSEPYHVRRLRGGNRSAGIRSCAGHVSEVRRKECRKEILHVMWGEARSVMRSRLRAHVGSSQMIPLVLGGIAGAAWMLLFFGDIAHADDCLRYVKEVKNFVAIPKDLLEDCMRTGSVQAIITAILGASGGGMIAIAVNKGLKGAADGEKQKPVSNESATGKPTDYTPVFENDFCSKCGEPLGEMTPGGRCRNCNTKNAVTNVGKCPRCGKFINLDGGECGACGGTFTR